MSTTETAPLDQSKLDAFVGRFVNDLGTALHLPTVLVGDRLGLYRAMADGEPVSPADLAELTGTNQRYVTEWLAAQAAAGYVDYDAEGATFRLPPEHAALLIDRGAPVFIPGAFQLAAAGVKDEPLITEAFRTGDGVAWHDHHPDLFVGCERFFRPGYAAHLTDEWLPALEGVELKLRAGAKVADVGCGHGASTIIMATAFPESSFAAFDFHDASIDAARRAAESADLGGRVRFDIAAAQDYPGTGYDLVTFFDCLHDMGDPVGAARHVLSSLAPDGTWMIVEPYANDRLEDNLNPVGKIYYGASTLVCTPASRAQEVGLALGAQAGEERMRNVVTEAGFTRFRRAAETPFNIVYEARP
ncbi:MAG: methyltransferase domain-containing protein [Acidimicrobiales bacterium]